ncbi:MAG: DUF1588 domain-containing protein, partial [Pirellulales bacterium]
CTDCHNEFDAESGISLSDVATFADRDTDTWALVREKIQLGEMPPEDAEPLAVEHRQLLVDWIGARLRESGEVAEDKLQLPNYGNYVDHQSLFNAAPQFAPAAPVRLWRLRPEAYEANLGLGGFRQPTQPFSLLPGQSISDYAVLYGVDESSAEIVMRNAQKFVELQTQTKPAGDRLAADSPQCKPPILALLNAGSEPAEETIAAAVRYQFNTLLLREPTDDEIAGATALWRKAAADVGPLHASRVVLAAPLLKPEALFRVELGAGELDEHGRRRLTPREIAFALSYSLTEKPPYRYNLPKLAAAAEAGDLDTRDGVAAAVREALDGKLDDVPRVMGFFEEYFNYAKAIEVFKEDRHSPLPHRPDYLVRDTRQLVRDIVEQDENVLAELLTTNKSYVFYNMTPTYRSKIAAVYGLPADWKPVGDRGPVELDPKQRAGILTQPSWLVAQSGNFDNDPIHRGKWIQERLLGGTIPDIPINVDAVVPEDEHKTLRERYSVTEQQYCWKCHQRMNPLGMPFEAYTHFGMARTRELEQPVDTRGVLEGTGDAQLDGEVSDAVDLMQRLAKSERVRQVFVRHVFRYFLGRNETLRDAQTLQDADRAYTESGGSMKALITSLLSSDSFLYRILDTEQRTSSAGR